MQLRPFTAEKLDLDAMKKIVGGVDDDDFDPEGEDPIDSFDGYTRSRRSLTTCSGTDHDGRRGDFD